jgi:hypothetical protein
VFEALRFAADLDRNERDQELGARVDNGEKFGADGGDLHAELLGEFAASCIGVGFTRFTFPAWEFVEAAVTPVRAPLTDEETIARLNDRGDHANRSRSHLASCQGKRAARLAAFCGLLDWR